MRKIGNTLVFAAIVLVVGPFFGFTVRGQQNTSYTDGLLMAIVALIVGVLFIKLSDSSNRT